MSNELVVLQDRTVTPQLWNMIKEMAPIMYEARLFGVANFQQAAAIMLKGHELGLGITASFELVQVVMGKPSLSPRGALALLHNSPEIKEIKVTDLRDPDGKFLGTECYMKRSNGFEYTTSWTLEDAKKAGLIKPDSGWANYPVNMCRWRAIGFCADVVAPDVLAGMSGLMKAPEQYGVALSESGDVIDIQVHNVPQNPAPAPVESPVSSFSLDQLVDLFGADKVLLANNGKLPETQADIDGLALKLAEGAN